MFKLNKSTKFALYSIFELSKNPQKILAASEIAQKYGISEHHVAKVLQQLAKIGMIHSIRGINGGFQIAKNPKELTMLDVVEVFEPRLPQNSCNLSDSQTVCSQKDACQIGEVFLEIQEQAYYTLKSISIATLLSNSKI